jgi:hypothetical protein
MRAAIDDPSTTHHVRSQTLDKIGLAGRTAGDNSSSLLFGDLDCHGPDGTAASVDEDALSGCEHAAGDQTFVCRHANDG